MERIELTDNIRNQATFGVEATTFIKHIHDTKKPMVFTQKGKGVAVLLGINEYELLQEKIDVLQDVYRAENQIKSGKISSHIQAKKNILMKLKNAS